MFKFNIGTKEGKTYKVESEAEAVSGKKIHDKIKGEEISPELKDYEFEITGASDKAGFTAMKDVEGIGLKRVLLSYGKAMKNRPKKEGKQKRSKNMPKGLRLRRTVRGKVISGDITQINLKILKEGKKPLKDILSKANEQSEETGKETQEKKETKT